RKFAAVSSKIELPLALGFLSHRVGLRTKEAIEVLNKLAQLNGKKLPKNLAISVPFVEPNTTTKSIWSTNCTKCSNGNSSSFCWQCSLKLHTPSFAFFSSSTFSFGVSCTFCIFFSRKDNEGVNEHNGSKGSWLQLSAEAVGFMAASTTFDVLYVYCVELFPTNVCNFAMSMLRQALMLGASITHRSSSRTWVLELIGFIPYICGFRKFFTL
ncbi:hypothetical protein IFM89_038104, partial [Coptis chinensis]